MEDIALIRAILQKDQVKKIFLANGFTLVYETLEVIQFAGIGYVDVLLARRPIAEKILAESNENGRFII